MNTKANTPIKILAFPDMGIEAWMRFDKDSELYEVFASQDCDDYVGCADNIPEAKQVAREWAKDRMSY